MKKAKDLRDLTDEELEVTMADLHKQRFELLNAIKTSKGSKENHLIPDLRRDIARVKTVQRERQIQQNKVAAQ